MGCILVLSPLIDRYFLCSVPEAADLPGLLPVLAGAPGPARLLGWGG
jgi:hypothetical protein